MSQFHVNPRDDDIDRSCYIKHENKQNTKTNDPVGLRYDPENILFTTYDLFDYYVYCVKPMLVN